MKHKLVLYPDTFLWVKGNIGLLYNAKSFTIKDFMITPSIRNICEQLLNFDNLYTVSIDENNSDISCKEFVECVVNNKFGKIVDENTPVISLPPLLNIQFDVERLKNAPDMDIGESVLTYFHSLTIYVGGSCLDSQYYKQIIYPVSSANDKILSTERVYDFLKSSDSSYLHTINIVISDIENSEIESMLSQFEDFKNKIIFHFIYSGFENDIVNKILNLGYKVNIICELPMLIDDKYSLRNNIVSLKIESDKFQYNFLIRSIEEYQFWSDLVENHNIINYQLIPVYDNNDEFFRENIFLTKSDIEESKLSRREVFAHQALNTLLFGALTIMPDGQIFSNVNCESIGSIDDSIYDLIVNELEQNHAWRKIRNSPKCAGCIYQWLCPSPSYYEEVMGVEFVCNNI